MSFQTNVLYWGDNLGILRNRDYFPDGCVDLRVNREAVAAAAESGLLLATELADYLVHKGVPFREAHGTVGRLVRYCLQRRKELRTLSLDELRSFSPQFEKDALDALTVDGAVERKAQIGGTARPRVQQRIKALRKALA